jgi:hypothetical protein
MQITFRCDPALIDLLPRPVPARDVLPEWLRRMAPRVPSPLHGRAIRTVKQCPPFVDAMTHGFVILLPCDIRVHEQRFSWEWPLPPLALPDHPRAPLSFHVPQQFEGAPFARAGRAALKFNGFWTIELPTGWSLMAVHPLNRDDLPFRLLSGVVDADRFVDIGINFPAIWIDAGFDGVLPRGTPIAQCFPVPRESPQLVCEAMSVRHQKRYEQLGSRVLAEPGVYRRGFRSKRSQG